MKKIILISSMFMSLNVFSAAYTCAGKVTGLSINPKNGYVLAEHIGPLVWPQLCSVEQDVNGVTAESCKVIYSTLLTAQMSDKNVMLWFNDDKDCSVDSHRPWGALTGWYFGPKLY